MVIEDQSKMMSIDDGRPAKNRPPKRLVGYINRIEQRTIGGPCKRRYWFALSDDSPYLYWYKNKGDISCAGRVPLSGAAFTFDPRETGRFEIHVNNEIHVLETADNKSRVQWLQQLQSNRRRHYEKENVDDILKIEIVSLSSHSLSGNDHCVDNSSNTEMKNLEQGEDMVMVVGPPEEKSLEDEINDAVQSTFYLNSDGELNAKSLEMPILIPPSTDVLRSAEELIEKITEETQAKAKILEQPAKKVIGKAKATLRLSSSLRPSCEHCKILLGIVNELKDRCYELTDEVGANQDLVTILRQSLLKSNRQIELIQGYFRKRMEEQKNPQDRISMILEKESELTALQLNAASYSHEIRVLKEQNKQYEQKIEELSTEIDAFRESVRSKEELIMKIYNEQEGNDALSRSDVLLNDVEVPEGILVDFGSSPTDENAQRVFDEAAVNDVTEMRDLVMGYRNQNMFLNQESLEDRERRIIRQNFDIEACYYQLKSRYIMVLNHFRASKTDSRVLEPGVIEALIDETNWTANKRTLNNDKIETRLTDSLGFYLNDDRKRHQLQPTDMFEVAAELKSISDEIVGQQEMEQNPQYIDWLQKWDSFLVNSVVRPLKPSTELKNLVRTGIPKTYRPRVWKSLVNYIVGDEKADLGNGYYETLLRKVNAVSANTIENDSALKQIDLDLARTLPTNRFFDEPTSEKIVVLRRVLCAYRFHNKSVGYCQGLNRLAAIALLFLEESDAFWFLVACVEYLQPAAYYTSTLLCAVADQKVLRDLVSEKLPKLSSHLRKFEVDLSAFTLSWFLTCFVDVFPHAIYLNLFDVFLYEGNKVLFRFALGVLKLAEASVLECKSVGAVHASLSRIAQYVPNFKTLAQIAFNDLNPFPQKGIEMKRQFYLSQLTATQ
ncbi:unnamed protein product [Onchocerca ochengi]|uniref:PH domain-containing protein n=1 Tax=Onchocerca ochengi TaxID=42157 RepID=A0A182EA91_ONCOC|nr:unnamed protein product [Onchocerca ochengi]